MSFTLRLVKGSALTWAEFDNNLTEIEAKWLEIVTIGDNALAAANFVGQWSSLTGSLSIPAATYWSGKFWMLLADVVDVTAHEPGVSASWAELVAGNVLGPVSATAGNVAILDATGKVLSDGGVAPSALMPKTGGVFTGDVVVPSINGGQLAGLRNKIINGNFDVWQAGTSAAGATGSGTGYAADMWQGTRASFATGMTLSRQLAGLTGHQYCARIQRDSGNSGTGIMIFGSVLETPNSLGAQGQTLTLSFRARAGANFSAASNAMTCYVSTGTGTDQNCVTGVFTGQVNNNAAKTLTTSWQTFSMTVTVGANVTQLAAMFFFTPTGTAGAADYMEIAGVQLETGTVATPFEQRPIGMELALCQRYYRRFLSVAGSSFGSGTNISTTQSLVEIKFPTGMRAAPTGIEQSGTPADYQIRSGAATVNCSAAPTFSSAVPDAVLILLTAASGLGTGDGCILRSNGTAAYIGVSARL